jgi:hypothetical protein
VRKRKRKTKKIRFRLHTSGEPEPKSDLMYRIWGNNGYLPIPRCEPKIKCWHTINETQGICYDNPKCPGGQGLRMVERIHDKPPGQRVFLFGRAV